MCCRAFRASARQTSCSDATRVPCSAPFSRRARKHSPRRITGIGAKASSGASVRCSTLNSHWLLPPRPSDVAPNRTPRAGPRIDRVGWKPVVRRITFERSGGAETGHSCAHDRPCLMNLQSKAARGYSGNPIWRSASPMGSQMSARPECALTNRLMLKSGSHSSTRAAAALASAVRSSRDSAAACNT
jgi:hypothetical protein